MKHSQFAPWRFVTICRWLIEYVLEFLAYKRFIFKKHYLRRIEDCFLDSGSWNVRFGQYCSKNRNFHAWYTFQKILDSWSRILDWWFMIFLEFWPPNVTFQEMKCCVPRRGTFLRIFDSGSRILDCPLWEVLFSKKRNNIFIVTMFFFLESWPQNVLFSWNVGHRNEDWFLDSGSRNVRS